MVILQKETTTGSQTEQYSKPITTQAEAISAQQKSIASAKPRSELESSAINKQLRLLGDYESIQRQQAVVESRFEIANANQFYSIPVSSPFAQANSESQIKALATVEIRNSLLAAVRYSVEMWRLLAHFQNIQISAQTAIGTPGCLSGPQLAAWIAQAPGVCSATGYLQALVTAVANAISDNFSQWQLSVTVPGLMWYPTFSAWPGPFAPPMPNIPMPLIACVAHNHNKLMSASQLELAIKNELASEFNLPEIDLFLNTLSVQLANYFTTWLCAQQVTMVMGMGPVPSFAPPYAPAGPVVGGYVIPSPGHLAA
jgi:hypothetical protein